MMMLGGLKGRKRRTAPAGACFDHDVLADRVLPAADRAEPATTPPPAALVERLALAMAAPRPWQRVTDPAPALAYFRAEARRRLDTLAGNPMAQGLLVSAEEAAARRYAAMVEHARGTRR